MSVTNPHELFVLLLSNVRQGTERTTKIFQEISQVAQHSDVKEALEARVFVSHRTLEKLDQCFKLIGEQLVKLSGRLQRGIR
jgi:ferritin-like metal-binding protein YciE